MWFLLNLILTLNSAFAQIQCIDLFQSDSTLFKTLSTELLKINDSTANHQLDLALFSTGTGELPADGTFANRYYQATKLAADRGVLGAFLTNLITVRFVSLKDLLENEGWDQIDKLTPDSIERMIQTPRVQEGRVPSIQDLPLADRQIIESVIVILWRRLDNDQLRLLVNRTSVPSSSVDFSGPYRQTAQSFMQQAVASGSLTEVFSATRQFFKDKGYNLPQEEIVLLESF